MTLSEYRQAVQTEISNANYGAMTADERKALAVRADIVRTWQTLAGIKVANLPELLRVFLASEEYTWLKSQE